MANLNCNSCDDLRTYAPDFATNGVTDDVCASLKNNSGFSTSDDRDNCTDISDANDCLIGNMTEELEAYGICDWKKFMLNLIPNIYNVIKAIVCSMCGLWTHVETLETLQEDMCMLMDQVASPNLLAYGPLPLATSSAAIARRCGTVTNKVVRLPDDGTLNPYIKASQNMGIAYAQMTVHSCTNPGRQEMLEWIAPNHFYYKLAAGASSGDVLWKITKAQAQSVIGISDFLWEVFTESSWTWHECALTPNRQMAWMKIAVGTDGLSANELGVIYQGCSAPNNAISADQLMNSMNNASAKLYRHLI